MRKNSQGKNLKASQAQTQVNKRSVSKTTQQKVVKENTQSQGKKSNQDIENTQNKRSMRSRSRGQKSIENKKRQSVSKDPQQNNVEKKKKSDAQQSQAVSQINQKSQNVKKRNAQKSEKLKAQSENSQDEQDGDETVSDKILFKKGCFLAYFDPTSDDALNFKLGKVIKDAYNNDQELQCDIYESKEKGKLEYFLTHQDSCVFDNTIIQEVKVEVIKSNAKKGKAPDIHLKIKKLDLNRIQKLIPPLLKAIKKDSDEESQTSSHEDSDEESDESPQQNENKVSDQKSISNTQIKNTKNKKANKEDEEMNDENEDDSQDKMQIDSSTQLNNKQKKGSQIGKKRNQPEKKDDHVDNGLSDQEDKSDRDEIQKRRKVGKSASQKDQKLVLSKKKSVKPKVKKPLTVFKLGAFNPDIQIIEEEPVKDSTLNKILEPKCCIRCNNRNIHRASMTANYELLKKLSFDKLNISRLSAFWGPDDKTTPLELLIDNGDPLLLELVLKPQIKLQKNQVYTQLLDEFYNSRAQEDPYLITFVDSGQVSRMAYGAYIRSVEMTRGSRQGNNAFIENDNTQKNLQHEIYACYSNLPSFYTRGKMTVEKYKILEKLKDYTPAERYQVQSSQFLDSLVRLGYYELAAYIIKDLWALSNYGFNELHYLSLCPPQKIKNLSEFKSVSVLKKAQNNKNITPLHFASINPHSQILKQLLEINQDINIQDFEMRKPIHYAAACENPENMQILIEKQANISDIDMKKVTCLHIAAQADRAENLRFILEKRPQLLKLKDRLGFDAMTFACENQSKECIDVLLQHGAKINGGVGKEKLTPLHYAASRGNFELCEFLIEKKAKINSKDKFKRSPLVMAVRNGHLKVASLLLSKGADWNQGDSSSNTPLHHAAAYGWQDCIDLLLKAGADINAQTSWKITPINVAMLKNHEGCVKKFLEHPEVDVNCKDEKGRTLLTLSLLNLREGSFEFIKYLIEKGADPNLQDADQQTSMHYLAKYKPSYGIYLYPHQSEQEKQRLIDLQQRRLEIQLQIADLLIQKGGSLTIKDSENRTPFSICLQNQNEDLLKKLLEGVTVNSDPQLFHQIKEYILNVKYQQILKELIQNETPKIESINVLDEIGMTPFLAYVDHFCNSFEGVRSNIFKIINYETSKKPDFNVNNITNYQLFDLQYLQTLDQGYYGNMNQGVNFGLKKAKKTISNRIAGEETDENDENKSNKVIDNETIDQKVQNIMDKLVVQPFIEIMQYLVMKKADPHAQVQKLKRFRDLEEKRRLQLIEGASNIQNAEQISQKQKEQERAKKREEVLKERQERKYDQKGRGKMKARPHNIKSSIRAKLELNKQEIEKTEEEYDIHRGLQNSFHFAIKCPHHLLIQFLENHKVNPDAEDFKKTTPLNLLSSSASNRYVDPDFQNLIQKLLSYNIRIDYPDIKGRTPFLNFYGVQSKLQAYNLLKLGANVNQMDDYGLFALKYAMIRRDGEELQNLAINYGANINQIDGKGRNLLHHAINMSSSTADATFDIEQVLIELGININLKDQRKRTPLHYAFVKMKKWNDTIQIDPIETVSSLCGCKGLEIDVPDQWLKTPLHYASQRGASICAMYLQKRGADLESIDIYGNTPLGVGILSKHFNYAIIMIQKNADVLKLVHPVDPKKIELMMKQQQTTKDHDMDDLGEVSQSDDSDSEFDHKNQGKHRKIFDKDPNRNNFYDSEGDYDDESVSNHDESDYEQNVFNQQNAFGLQIYNNQPQKKTSNFQRFLIPQTQNQSQPLSEQILNQAHSMFRLSIKYGQLGLAYLMLDQGYNLMKAMQDALDEKKFQLVLTFLSKNPDDSIIRQKNDKNQNLFHILSQNASSCRLEQLNKIYNALKTRGVNCLEQDGYGKTALHYAVESRNKDLVIMLLNEGADPTLLDIYGYSPLILYLKGKSILDIYIYNSRNGDFDVILKSLIERGANLNQIYSENSLKSIYSQEVEYKTTPIINYVRQYLEQDLYESQKEKFLSGFLGLILCDSRFDIFDSDGCDVLVHAIRNNNFDLFTTIIQKSKKAFLSINNQDVMGKTAIHHIVKPRNYGSFENTYMIDELVKLNYNVQIQDINGKEPIQYALQQQSGKMRKKLAMITNQNQLININQRKMSGIPIDQWQQCQVDPENDSELFMKEAQEKEDKEVLNDLKNGQKKAKELVPVDQTGRFEKSYRVLCENGKPWDAYLTKVDLKNGIYGDYVFYKIQLLHDSVRDLYVVFTRYGRIGEDGMNQRTPFNKLEDAKKEFCTIFKSKTQNEFNIEDLSSFQKQNKKYNLAKVTYSTVQHKDYLAPFDFEKCAKSNLDKPTRLLIEEIANITMYQRAMVQIGIDTSILPLSNINKQTVINAMDVLKQLSLLIQEDQLISQKGVQEIDYDLLAKGKDKIVELSSKYYELIPLSRYKDKSAPPICYPHIINQLFSELEVLVNIEHASKILLGALYRQQEIHPIDYVYSALNIDIQYVDSTSDEHLTIQQYVENTNESSIDFKTHKLRVFRVQRKGEAEEIADFLEIPNQRLLFHGSQLYNFLGILSQGLRIAPPEAPATGYMFGKGIYFADAFCKSINYAQKSFMNQQDSNLLLLCQVVLGNQRKIWQPEYVENLQSQYQSVHGVGRRGPDYKKTLTLDNGIEIPFGKMIDYKDFDPEFERSQQNNAGFGAGLAGRRAIGMAGAFAGRGAGVVLEHNEFIVYSQSQVKMRYLLQIVQKSKEELKNQN